MTMGMQEKNKRNTAILCRRGTMKKKAGDGRSKRSKEKQEKEIAEKENEAEKV